MTEIANNKKRLQEWIDKNLEFCIKEYGKENIVRFAVHLDEKHRIFIAFCSYYSRWKTLCRRLDEDRKTVGRSPNQVC